MPGHTEAKAIRDALEAGQAIKAMVDHLYEEIGQLDYAAVIDTGAGEYLIALPGYTPLSSPGDYVHIGKAA